MHVFYREIDMSQYLLGPMTVADDHVEQCRELG